MYGLRSKLYTNYTQQPYIERQRVKESKSQRDKESKRQRVKEIKSQRDKESKRQRVKETKSQRDKESKSQRVKKTKSQRVQETKGERRKGRLFETLMFMNYSRIDHELIFWNSKRAKCSEINETINGALMVKHF